MIQKTEIGDGRLRPMRKSLRAMTDLKRWKDLTGTDTSHTNDPDTKADG
jgi:hypothetical protein